MILQPELQATSIFQLENQHMSINRPRRRWFHMAPYVLLSICALARNLKKLLPSVKVIVNGKRLFSFAMGEGARPRDRIYTLPMDSTHMYCPHCEGSIPTHDVLLALRPPPRGNSHLLLVDWGGRIGLINERDYNPVQMRIATPGSLLEGKLENWSAQGRVNEKGE